MHIWALGTFQSEGERALIRFGPVKLNIKSWSGWRESWWRETDEGEREERGREWSPVQTLSSPVLSGLPPWQVEGQFKSPAQVRPMGAWDWTVSIQWDLWPDWTMGTRPPSPPHWTYCDVGSCIGSLSPPPHLSAYLLPSYVFVLPTVRLKIFEDLLLFCHSPPNFEYVNHRSHQRVVGLFKAFHNKKYICI